MTQGEPDPLEARQRRLVEEVRQPGSSLYLHTLLDALVALFDECTRVESNPHAKHFTKKYGPVISKLRSLRLTSEDFKIIKTLGRGAFGEVNLCKCKANDKFYAVKKLNKAEMLSRQEAFFMEERDLLGLIDTQWITKLEYAFQDDEYLYLVMEYLAGGNMLNLLYKHGSFEEEKARFYIAETIQGVQKIHGLNFVYRDLKPENMLLNRDGHIKLADFGSCFRLNAEGLIDSQVAAGTPDYISPEVLQSYEGKKGQCGKESDWWSVGVVLYEMLCADPPFMGDNLSQTYGMIMEHKTKFKFPDDIELSEEAKSLIKGLICDRAERLTFEQIVAHPFFKGLDWDSLHKATPPFVPELKGPDDTTYFEDEELPDLPRGFHMKNKKSGFSGENFPFVGYTFFRPADAKSGAASSVASLPSSSSVTEMDLEAKEEEAQKLKQALSDGKALNHKKLKDASDKVVEKAQEGEKKDKLIAEEISYRKALLLMMGELEKELVERNLDLEKLERKREKVQAEARSDEDRIRELDEEMSAARAVLFQTQQRRTTDSELESTKQKIEDSTKLLNEVQTRNEEIRTKNSLLQTQIQRTADALHAEKAQRAKYQLQIAEAAETVKGLSSELDRIVRETADLAQKNTELQNTHAGLAPQSQEAKARIDALLSDRERLSTLRNQLEIANKELQAKATLSEQKEKELSSKLGQYAVHARIMHEAKDNSRPREVIQQLEQQLSQAQADQQGLKERQNETTKRLTGISKEVILAQKKIEDEEDTHNKTLEALRDARQRLDQYNSHALALEAELQSLKEKAESVVKNIKELELMKEREAERERSFQSKLADALAIQEEKQKRLEALISQQVQVMEKNAALEAQLRASSDKEQGSGDDARQGQLSELQQIKTQLEQEIKRSLELDDSLVKVQTEKLQLDKEKAENEKKLLSERQESELLLSAFTSTQESLHVLRKHNESSVVQIEKLKEQIAKLEKRTKKREKDVAEAQEALKTLRDDIETKQKELEQTKTKLAAGPKSEVREKKEFRKLREDYTLLQMRFQNEELAKRSLEIKREELQRSNSRLISELEALKKMSDTKDWRSSTGSTESSKSREKEAKERESSDEALTSPSTIMGNLKRNLSKRRSRVDSQKSFPDSLALSSTIEGYLKIPKEGKVRHGWVKKYVVVKDFLITAFDKEKDKGTSTDGKVLCDIRWSVFFCKEASEASAYAKKEEIPFIFLIHTRPSPVSQSPFDLGSDFDLKPAQLKAKIEALGKEKAIEEGILQGFEKMLQISVRKDVQQQYEGAKNKIEQLNSHLARLRLSLEQAEFEGNKKLQLTEESIKSELKYQRSLSNLLELAEDQLERDNTSLQLQESKKKLEELQKQFEEGKKEQGRRTSSAQLGEELRVRECNGHRFVLTSFHTEQFCQHCERLLHNHQGYVCQTCEYTCHKECHTLGKLSCGDRLSLKTVAPLYFMTSDPEDTRRWVDYINRIRETHSPASSPRKD